MQSATQNNPDFSVQRGIEGQSAQPPSLPTISPTLWILLIITLCFSDLLARTAAESSNRTQVANLLDRDGPTGCFPGCACRRIRPEKEPLRAACRTIGGMGPASPCGCHGSSVDPLSRAKRIVELECQL